MNRPLVTQLWRQDVLGARFESLELPLAHDDEGPVVTTLVRCVPEPPEVAAYPPPHAGGRGAVGGPQPGSSGYPHPECTVAGAAGQQPGKKYRHAIAGTAGPDRPAPAVAAAQPARLLGQCERHGARRVGAERYVATPGVVPDSAGQKRSWPVTRRCSSVSASCPRAGDAVRTHPPPSRMVTAADGGGHRH